MPSIIEPGMRVRHPDRPDWGEGQVQSVIGNRITVNFEHAGKLLINAALVELEVVEAVSRETVRRCLKKTWSGRTSRSSGASRAGRRASS